MCRCHHQPPVSVLMENSYNTQDSRQSRSRSNSRLSSTAEQFQGLNINLQHRPSSSSSSTGASSSLGIHPTDFRAALTTITGYLDPNQPSPKSFNSALSAPVQHFTPFPLFSEPDLDANWYLTSTEEHSDSVPLPLVRVEHPSFGDQRSSRANSNPAAMR